MRLWNVESVVAIDGMKVSRDVGEIIFAPVLQLCNPRAAKTQPMLQPFNVILYSAQTLTMIIIIIIT